MVTPRLLGPDEADEEVYAADHGVVALHGSHNLAVGQITVLHLALGIADGRLTHRLKLFAICSRCDCDQRWCCVEASCLDSLIVLDDETFNIELRGLPK